MDRDRDNGAGTSVIDHFRYPTLTQLAQKIFFKHSDQVVTIIEEIVGTSHIRSSVTGRVVQFRDLEKTG
jgi:hypothetical protein